MMQIKDGEVDLRGCVISKNGTQQQQSIKAQIVSINVYEAIDRGYLVADFLIEDGIGLMDNFPIVGEESIFLDWACPNGSTFRQSFTIEAIQNVSVNNEHTVLRYNLRCLSPHAMQNAAVSVTKAYPIQTIDETVKSVLQQEMGFTGSIDATRCLGPQKIVSPRWRPMQLINFLKHRAVSAEDQSSLFAAYYDRTGTFRFRTIESLIANPIGSKQYGRFRSGDTNFAESNMNQLLKWHIPQRENTFKKIAEGAYGVQVLAFDFFTKQLIATQSDINSNYITTNRYASGDGTMNSPLFRAAMSVRTQAGQTKRVFVPVNLAPDEPSTYQADVQNKKLQYAASMEGLALAEVYGDCNIGVGSVVAFTIPKPDTVFDQSVRGSIDRMPYLIMRCKHSLTRDMDKFMYKQTFECLLTGYAK